MPRWEINKTALFHDLSYVPHAGQLPIHASRARFRVIAAGTRFGKSTACAAEAVVELLTPRPVSTGWICAPSLELTDRIFQRVAHFVQTKLKHHIKEVDLRERRIVVRNLAGGLSAVCCKSTDSPVGLLGEALHWLICDEAARIRTDTWDEFLAPRLIDYRGTAILVSSPAGKNWFWRQFTRGLPGRDPEYFSLALPTWSNPSISADLIENERKRLPSETFRELYGAEFLGQFEGTCPTCGAPDPTVPSVRFSDESDAEPANCIDCGWPVDASGHTLVTWVVDGVPNRRVRLVFQARRDGTEPHIERMDPEIVSHAYPTIFSGGKRLTESEI